MLRLESPVKSTQDKFRFKLPRHEPQSLQKSLSLKIQVYIEFLN